MANSAYLKKYVENHPNNKMAWYLLGKEYEASGQEGKARYCYIQAGSVYENFESSKIPEDLWMGYKDGLLQETKRRESRGRLLRKIGVALAILLMMWIPSAHAPGDELTAPLLAGETADQNIDGSGAPAGTDDDIKNLAAPNVPLAGPVFTAKGYFGQVNPQGEAFSGLLELEGQAGRKIQDTAVLGMARSGNWLIWSDDMPVVYGLTQSPEDGRVTIQSYDSAGCRCKPPDVSDLKSKGRKWIIRQESLGVLSSAILQYKQTKGSWPASLKDLTGEFPGNWLAGSSKVLKQSFDPMLKHLVNASHSGGSPKSEALSADKGGFPPGEQPYFTEPFEIVVDKKVHRLAVVSGNIIVRSYAVGLGGDHTPEGHFSITDKVVNPNGKDNGEFGSRGMQLSDTNYAIHGTNEPDSIGKDESKGCVRMGKKDVEELFDLVPKGTKVTIGKGILPTQESVPKERFTLGHRKEQTNPHRTYHWLD